MNWTPLPGNDPVDEVAVECSVVQNGTAGGVDIVKVQVKVRT